MSWMSEEVILLLVSDLLPLLRLGGNGLRWKTCLGNATCEVYILLSSLDYRNEIDTQ